MDLSRIEQGIKDAIKNLQRPYISSIESYGGDFDDGLNKDVIRRFPAIWTTFQGTGKPEQISARKFRVPLVFVVLVGAYSIRNEETARQGLEVDGKLVSIGTFQLLQDVQLALLNNNLAAHDVCGITPFTYGKIDKVFDNRTANEALSVFAQQWHTSCIVSRSAADRDIDMLDAEWMQVVNVDYMFKEGDDVADMSDFIKLPITLDKDK
ncbi:phage protein Gp37 [Acinetobacter sp. CFCC 10889]|uniref:phage protein Gp37 n=1 Tax=Acinetobacter sp. CFCC 10889 TaxID=1775557 RepID=UPI000DD0DC61|nr:phage protein Gp37 [Acinetobacter sp. CFCC 10889]